MKGSNLGGYLITFEGGEGSGKSTAVSALALFLSNKDLGVRRFREPGGTLLGDEIRKAVHSVNNTVYPETEALMYQASRAQLVSEKIIPALESGKIVIMDRFTDSSLAYQGMGRGLGIEKITMLNNFSTRGLVPDLTFLLDIDPEIGLERKKESRLEMNRLDLEKIDFHRKVRKAYLDLVESDGDGRWVAIDASHPWSEISNEILGKTETRLREAGLIEGNLPSPERRG